MEHRLTFAILILLAISTLACSVSPISPPAPLATHTPSPPASPTSAIELAGAYVTALHAGDRARVEALIEPDPWCSPAPDVLEEKLDRQLTIFGSSDVRNVTITKKDISGWVVYPPEARAACASFEFRATDSAEWQPAGTCVVTVGEHICDLGTIEREE